MHFIYFTFSYILLYILLIPHVHCLFHPPRIYKHHEGRNICWLCFLLNSQNREKELAPEKVLKESN